MIYENEYSYFIRKPAGLASSLGTMPCLLDRLQQGSHGFHGSPNDQRTGTKEVSKYIQEKMNYLKITPVKNVESVCTFLLHTFSREEEYGLLNRLDTPTSGFLYFAKTRKTYTDHRAYQEDHKLNKHYLAQVHGDIRYQFEPKESDVYIVDFPLMHHAHLDDRMVAVVHDTHRSVGRGLMLDSASHIYFVDYNESLNQSIIYIVIHQGRRHQIRAHCGGAGYPIVGDAIYGKKHHGEQLHLWSIGCELLQTK